MDFGMIGEAVTFLKKSNQKTSAMRRRLVHVLGMPLVRPNMLCFALLMGAGCHVAVAENALNSNQAIIQATLETTEISSTSAYQIMAPLPCGDNTLNMIAERIRAETVPSESEDSRIVEQIERCHWSAEPAAKATLKAAIKKRDFGPEPTTMMLKLAVGEINSVDYTAVAKSQIAESLPPGPFQTTMTGVPLDFAFGACLPDAAKTCIVRFLSATFPQKIKLDPASIIAFGDIFPRQNVTNLANISNQSELSDAASEIVGSGFPIDPHFLETLSPTRKFALTRRSDQFYILRYNVKAP